MDVVKVFAGQTTTDSAVSASQEVSTRLTPAAGIKAPTGMISVQAKNSATGAGDTCFIVVEWSPDNTNWFEGVQAIVPHADGTKTSSIRDRLLVNEASDSYTAEPDLFETNGDDGLLGGNESRSALISVKGPYVRLRMEHTAGSPVISAWITGV